MITQLNRLLLIALSILSLLPAFSNAASPIYTSHFKDHALNSYDTVAYFTVNKPVKVLRNFQCHTKVRNDCFPAKPIYRSLKPT